MPRSKKRKSKKARHRTPAKDPKRPPQTPVAEDRPAEKFAVVHPAPGFRDAAELEALCQGLSLAVDLLRKEHDTRLLQAFLEGCRVAVGLLAPWWRRMFQAPRATYLQALAPALAALNTEVERRQSVERHRLELHAKSDPISSPCLTGEKCENCSSRTEGLRPVVEDCAIGPPLGLRVACATLCRNCHGIPFSKMFGPAEISRRVRVHRTHCSMPDSPRRIVECAGDETHDGTRS